MLGRSPRNGKSDAIGGSGGLKSAVQGCFFSRFGVLVFFSEFPLLLWFLIVFRGWLPICKDGSTIVEQNPSSLWLPFQPD